MTNDEMFEMALKQALDEEIAECEKFPDHKFSHDFDRKMKRLFHEKSAAEKTIECSRVRKKLPIAVIVIISLFLFTGAAVTTYVLWHNFRLQDRGLYTLLNITDIENCPSTLEDRYELMADLSDFTKTIISDEPFAYDVEYDSDEKNIHIVFSQNIKHMIYALNTEEMNLPIKVTVNGCNGIYYETKYGSHVYIWDTGDYLIELSAHGIGKDELFSLAKFVQKIE